MTNISLGDINGLAVFTLAACVLILVFATRIQGAFAALPETARDVILFVIVLAVLFMVVRLIP